VYDPTNVMRKTSLISMLFPFIAFGQQEHPYIMQYDLTVLDGSILVAWTLQGGSTCYGLDVERSLDGLSFERVHRIEGICGDPTIAVPFSWIDNAPPEFSTVHYRIMLGLEGYSSVKSVEFDQLKQSDHRFFPSPMHNEARLLLNVQTASWVDLRIMDASGRVVFERSGNLGGDIHLALSDLNAGTYTFLAVSEGRRYVGRFVKQ
jgi:hypothetical protein